MALTRAQRFQASFISAAGYPLVAALGRTWTWTVDGAQHWDEVTRTGRQPILALWHGRILPATVFWRDRGIVALTSQNFDGEWTARLMGKFGYRAARGSTTRGGARALVQLRKELAGGHPVAFTVDGPHGPARVVQPGVVWLAGATGHPILPFHIEASRYWTTSSWDTAQLPKPFSRVAIAIGKPTAVPGTSPAIIDSCQSELGSILTTLERRAQAALAKG